MKYKGRIYKMKIVSSILTNNPCYTEGRKITVKGLMLHSVGVPQPKASVFIKNWNKASHDNACVHAFIDGIDGNVYQTLPWNHRGWHCGAAGNNTHIGVEMCEPDTIEYTSGASFVANDVEEARKVVTRTYNSAVELFAKLCADYNLDPMGNGVIVSHTEGYARGIASNHADPEHLWKGLKMSYTMGGFRRDVKEKKNGISSTKVTSRGADSRTTFIRAVQEACGAAVDGIAGSETIGKTVTISYDVNDRHAVVKPVQTYLNVLGYDCGSADGLFGWKTRAAVKSFQKANGCVQDGEITARNKTWRKLLGMS